MCDFHSILGVAIGNEFTIHHDPDNSHSKMGARLNLLNKPNRQPVIFEAEWNGEGDVPSDTILIRQCGECPKPLAKRIRAHYHKLKEALTEGKHLGKKGYFSNHEKYADVWTAAMSRGHMPDFSEVETFSGSVDVREGATLTAPALAEVSGSVVVREGATLTAPKLKRK